MKKRGLILIIFFLVVLLNLVFVIRLTHKNSTLKYLSDDKRQIELLKTLTSSVVEEKIEDEKITLNVPSDFFLNFINKTAYVTSQKEDLSNSISSLNSTDSKAIEYTVSSSFNLKKLSLTLKFEKETGKDSTLYYEVVYKLKKNTKNNTIDFKEKSFTIHETGS